MQVLEPARGRSRPDPRPAREEQNNSGNDQFLLLPRLRRRCARVYRACTRMAYRCFLFAVLFAAAQFGQANTGELRVTVTDTTDAALPGPVEVFSQANEFHQKLNTDSAGVLVLRRLPFGWYRIRRHPDGVCRRLTIVKSGRRWPSGISRDDESVDRADADHRCRPRRRFSIPMKRRRCTAWPQTRCCNEPRPCPAASCLTS